MNEKLIKAAIDMRKMSHSPYSKYRVGAAVETEFGEIIVTPNPKFGEPSTWTDLNEFKQAVMNGTLHTLDAKLGVADGISRGLEKVAQHFENSPELLEMVSQIVSKK